MEDQKLIKQILKTLNVLDYSANQDKIRSMIKQGIDVSTKIDTIQLLVTVTVKNLV